MNPWLFAHLFFLGIWAGCVAVEMVIEFYGRKEIGKQHQTAQLHYLIDLCVEIPVLIMVLASGMMLFDASKLTVPYYKLKIIMGFIPIGINALCVIPVALRKKAADRSDEPVMKRNTKWIFAAFYSGFAAALVALGIGMHFLGIF